MTFALDPVWPPLFRSRTCDPADSCFVGRIGGEANRAHAPAQSAIDALCGKVKWAGEKPAPAPTKGTRLIVGTYAWRVWSMCKVAPQTSAQLCAELDVGVTHLPSCLKRLIDADVLRKQRGGGRGRQLTYSIGPGPVVEVSA